MPNRAGRPAPRGFTLIEIAVTLVVIGCLAALAVPQIRLRLQPARELEAPIALQRFVTLQQLHRSRHGEYASAFDDLEADIRPIRASKFYVYRISGSNDVFTACATPRPEFLELTSYQINEGSILREIEAAECIGNP